MTEFAPPGTRYHALPSPFRMKRGGVLHGARIAFETWGELSPGADNAVLLDTQAVSYAAAGRFGDAVRSARRALAVAAAGDDASVTEAIRDHLALFEVGRDYSRVCSAAPRGS